MGPSLKAIDVVFAEWCPHCVPTAVEPMKEAARELGVPFRPYDIDGPKVATADALVKEHGDWTPDYLVPQVFLEFDDGSVKHVLTGDPRGVAFTRRAVEEFLRGDLYKSLKKAAKR